jgi:hypothetical protein
MTTPASPTAFKPVVASFYQEREQLVAKMARPLVTATVPAPLLVQNRSHPSSFFADFGREFQVRPSNSSLYRVVQYVAYN